jgi:hypothetical protein
VANYTADNSRCISATGNNNTNYSIVAAKYVQNEISGLYNPNGWGNGKFFDIVKLPENYLNSANQHVTGRIMKLNFGMKMANPNYVTSIVNIDKAANLKTIKLDEMISTIIEEARGADVLYMHPSLKRMIGTTFKLEKMNYVPADTAVNLIVDSWDNVPIITDYNLAKGTELNVTLS